MAEAETKEAKIIDGKAIAKLIHADIREEISVLKERYGKVRTASPSLPLFPDSFLVIDMYLFGCKSCSLSIHAEAFIANDQDFYEPFELELSSFSRFLGWQWLLWEKGKIPRLM